MERFAVIRYCVRPTPTAKSATGAAASAIMPMVFAMGAGMERLEMLQKKPRMMPITIGFRMV